MSLTFWMNSALGFLGWTTESELELDFDPALLLLSSLEDDEDPLPELLEPESLAPSLDPALGVDLGVDFIFIFGVDFEGDFDKGDFCIGVLSLFIDF
jgi:hypothetical protein